MSYISLDQLRPLLLLFCIERNIPALSMSAFPLLPFCSFRLSICFCSDGSQADLGVRGISVGLLDRSLALMLSMDPEAMTLRPIVRSVRLSFV